MKRKIPSLDKRYTKHRPVSEDEAELWLKAMTEENPFAPVKPPPRDKAASSVPAKKKRKVEPTTPVLDRPTSAKIRRGVLAIEATLDLHGATQETAHALLIRFIAQAEARSLRTVLVITGKGRGGKDGVLRRLLPLWLDESPLRERIIAYDVAGPRHGGGGAWYIRIKKGTRF